MQLGFVAGPGLVVFFLCGLWFISRMKLTRERFGEISEILAERAADPAAAPGSSVAPTPGAEG